VDAAPAENTCTIRHAFDCMRNKTAKYKARKSPEQFVLAEYGKIISTEVE
jgi:hypothetical protein